LNRAVVIVTIHGAVLLGLATSAPCDERLGDKPDFAKTIGPFLTEYCTTCHGEEDPEAELYLASHLNPASNIGDAHVWERALRMLDRREMPPDIEPQPTAAEVNAVRTLIRAELAKFDCQGKKYPGRVTIRRLNRAEYNNTIRDLVGVDFQPADDFPSDDVGAGFDNIGDVLSMPPLLVEKYLSAAEEIVMRAMRDDSARARILVCDPSQAQGEEKEECYRRIVETFVSRAYRRPATREEVDRLLELRRSARQSGAEEGEALQVVLQAALASPFFLFRVELDPEPDDPDAMRELDGFELASRLSYFLWSTMPDEELFSLAVEDKVREPEVLRGQVTRMLQDPKAGALVKNFAGQWLQLRDMAKVAPDPEMFPDFDEGLRAAMQRETEMFFANIMRENRSVLEFLDADYTYLNQRLAKHYGIGGVEGEEFRRVVLQDQRRGVLTQASILTLTSNPTRTSPVKRGKWILENILGDPPPPPLPGIQSLEDQPELLGSLRERMQQHRADPNCAVCHKRMDALGFGLENFDATGAWRERDGKFPIDASGTLPGELRFDGPGELMQILKDHEKQDFCRCLTRKMLTYALGRELQPYDRCTVESIVKQLAEDDYRFAGLVLGIVTSDPFTMRGSKGGN
jgi:hypothetical protein